MEEKIASFQYRLTSTSSWHPEEKLVSSYPSLLASYTVDYDGAIKVEEHPAADHLDDKIAEGTDVLNTRTKTRKTFKCEICFKTFLRQAYLTTHIRTHGIGENPFKCDKCGKSFAKKSSFMDHHNLHTGTKPFTCNVCNQAFRNRDTLRGHKRKHDEEKPFACNFCKRSFTWRANLKRHEANHTNAKPFKCDKCAKTFFTQALLSEHDFSHTGISPHHCDVCGVDFATSHTLKVHYTMLHEKDENGNNVDQGDTKKQESVNIGRVKRHQCDKCGQKFDRNSKLVKHKTFQCYYVALEALRTKKLGVDKSKSL